MAVVVVIVVVVIVVVVIVMVVVVVVVVVVIVVVIVELQRQRPPPWLLRPSRACGSAWHGRWRASAPSRPSFRCASMAENSCHHSSHSRRLRCRLIRSHLRRLRSATCLRSAAPESSFQGECAFANAAHESTSAVEGYEGTSHVGVWQLLYPQSSAEDRQRCESSPQK